MQIRYKNTFGEMVNLNICSVIEQTILAEDTLANLWSFANVSTLQSFPPYGTCLPPQVRRNLIGRTNGITTLNYCQDIGPTTGSMAGPAQQTLILYTIYVGSATAVGIGQSYSR